MEFNFHFLKSIVYLNTKSAFIMLATSSKVEMDTETSRKREREREREDVCNNLIDLHLSLENENNIQRNNKRRCNFSCLK